MSTTVTKKTPAPKTAKKPAVKKPATKMKKPPKPEESAPPADEPAKTTAQQVLADRKARKAELAAMSPAQKTATKILGAMTKAGARKPYSGIIPGWVSSGCYLIDLVASLGAGLPYSKFIHIFGKKHTGKTYVAIQIAISVLAAGGLVFWHNQEDGWTNEFAALCGLDVDHPNFFLLPPELHQVCFDGITASIKELEGDDTPVLFVIDSLGGGCTSDRDTRKVAGKKVKKDGKEETTGARKVGDLAQVTKDFVNKTVPYLVHTMAMVVVTNHTYLDLSAYTAPGIPKPDVPVGGGALPFRSVIELKTSNPVTETQKDKLLYGKIKITSIKSKLIPRGLHCTVPIYFKQRKNRFCGLDDAMACIHYLVKQGVWWKNNDGRYVTHVQEDTDANNKPIYFADSLNALRDLMVDQESQDFYKEVKRVVEIQFRKQFGFD